MSASRPLDSSDPSLRRKCCRWVFFVRGKSSEETPSAAIAVYRNWKALRADEGPTYVCGQQKSTAQCTVLFELTLTYRLAEIAALSDFPRVLSGESRSGRNRP